MEAKKIHVGNYIKSTIKESGSTLSEIARKLDITRQKLNGWLKKDDMSVKDLFTISQAVGFDFVKAFCQPAEHEQETKVILHIEVEKAKANDVLKLIKDKQLYNVLKNNNK